MFYDINIHINMHWCSKIRVVF